MCGFWMQNSDLWTGITSLYGSQTWPFVFCIYDSVISTRLYGFQPSSVVLCIQNSELMTTIACVYESQPLSVSFACKTATFGAEFQGFMGPRHDPSFCACKTAWLVSELLVFMSPSPHVRFLDAKQRLLERNNKSLWVPDITCRGVHAKQRD